MATLLVDTMNPRNSTLVVKKSYFFKLAYNPKRQRRLILDTLTLKYGFGTRGYPIVNFTVTPKLNCTCGNPIMDLALTNS